VADDVGPPHADLVQQSQCVLDQALHPVCRDAPGARTDGIPPLVRSEGPQAGLVQQRGHAVPGGGVLREAVQQQGDRAPGIGTAAGQGLVRQTVADVAQEITHASMMPLSRQDCDRLGAAARPVSPRAA